MTTALLDGDIIAHQASARVHDVYDLGDGVQGSRQDAARAAEIALETVAAWVRLAGCGDAIVCFSGRQNFRKLILPSYKANRTKGKPPDFYTTVEAIEAAYNSKLIEGLEADDVMGLLATSPRDHGPRVVVTTDKDLQTVPGLHFNPNKDKEVRTVSQAEADWFWLRQTLTGDPTDGYKGVPGIGPKGAVKWLGEPGGDVETLWAQVVSAYLASKLTEQDALVQARVARILRHGEFDHAKQVVTLWHPTHPPKMALRFGQATT